MILPRKFLKFDYGVHILFGALIVISFASASILSWMALWIFISLIMLLGLWQLFSALFLTLGYGDKRRIYYLLGVTIYAILFLVFGYTDFSGIPHLFALPTFLIWYAILTYKDATYRTPSFWDLEF